MLPEKLSNNLCSLRPNEDKLTFSAVFTVNEKAEIIDTWYGRTVIHSDRRFTYEEAQERIEGLEDEYTKHIVLLNTLALQLRDRRFEAGAIGFETPEVKFQLDANGKPLAVVPRIRKDAHKLVEEFMLLANKGVAEYVYNIKKTKPHYTMVYRIHEAPDPDRIKVFSAFARKFGYKMDPESKKLAKEFNGLIEALIDKPEQDILQNLAVRTMSKARYSTEAMGHFGLAFTHYSHFTSPIRRYPDMMAHRLLQHYLEGKESVDAVMLEDGCRHSSTMERSAAEAERASVKYKQVEFMIMQDSSRVFDGIISGVT
jgi:ribonuclease R